MIRLFLFLFLVALIVPEGWLPTSPHVESRRASGEAIGIGELMHAVDQTWRDIGGLCERKPDVCDMGGRLGGQIRDRALTWTAAFAHWLEGLQDESAAIPVSFEPDRGWEQPRPSPQRGSDYGV